MNGLMDYPLANYFNVGDTVNKPYFKKWWSVPLTLIYSEKYILIFLNFHTMIGQLINDSQKMSFRNSSSLAMSQIEYFV